jgi:methyltransferase, FkbM family
LTISRHVPSSLAALTRGLRRPIKYRLMNPLDIEVWGLKLRLLPRGNMSEEKLYTAPQLFDPDEFELMRRVLKGGSIFVDVGANAGIYSFWASRCMDGQGRIIAIEPDPEMARRIRFNVATNKLGCIELSEVGLSDHEGTAMLRVNPQQRGTNSLDSSACRESSEGTVRTEVPVVTLVHVLQSRGVSSIDMLKIDIEGHEEVVLSHFFRNAPETQWPKLIISEFKHTGEDRVVTLLSRHGYRQRQTTRLNIILERA